MEAVGLALTGTHALLLVQDDGGDVWCAPQLCQPPLRPRWPGDLKRLSTGVSGCTWATPHALAAALRDLGAPPLGNWNAANTSTSSTVFLISMGVLSAVLGTTGACGKDRALWRDETFADLRGLLSRAQPRTHLFGPLAKSYYVRA